MVNIGRCKMHKIPEPSLVLKVELKSYLCELEDYVDIYSITDDISRLIDCIDVILQVGSP